MYNVQKIMCKKYLVLLFIVYCLLCIGTSKDVQAQTDYKLLAPLPLSGVGGGETSNTTAGPYIQGIFVLIIAIASGLAVLKIIFGGIKYMSTDAFSGKSEAKSDIEHALWGLGLAIGAYLILFTISPNLVEFNLNIPVQEIRSDTSASNLSTSSGVEPDLNPTIPNDLIDFVSVTSISPSIAEISWTSDMLTSNNQIEYGINTNYGYTTNTTDGSETTHNISLSNLEPGTTYNYRIKSTDASGNTIVSQNLTFTTNLADTLIPKSTAISLDAPAGITMPTISSIYTLVTSSGTTISWTTNEPTNTQVEYGLTTAYGNSTTLNSSLVTSHSQALSNLSANTLYHYKVKSKDGAGNLGGNLRVQGSSPAIDAGTALSQVTTDFDGVTRPQGSAYDIGAYEYK